MKMKPLIFALMLSLLLLPVLGCGSQPEAETVQAEPVQAEPVQVEVQEEVTTDEVVETVIEETAAEVEEVVMVEVEDHHADEAHMDEESHDEHMADGTHEKHMADGTYELHHGNDSDSADHHEDEDNDAAHEASEADEDDVTVEVEIDEAEAIGAVPFTATTGLDTFSAYRMNFNADFDGSRDGQPSAGTLDGTFEVTRQPNAQHWRIGMDGNTFGELAALGSMELYDFGNMMYIQNPMDQSWLGVPAELVKTMLPIPLDKIYRPEENIDLPLTAVPQPGQEVINGIETERYTFGADDLAGSTQYDNVEGTIWVAVNGDYIVKYDAVISGEFDNLNAGGQELMDEGTIVMSYNVTDVNGGFAIQPPANAQGLNLGALLSGLGNIK